MGPINLFQFLPRSVRQLAVLCLAALAPLVMAERGSHVTLDEPLPQPTWKLPLIANGEGTVTTSTDVHSRISYDESSVAYSTVPGWRTPDGWVKPSRTHASEQ